MNLQAVATKGMVELLRGQPFGNVMLAGLLGVLSTAMYYVFVKDGVLDRVALRMDATVEKIELRQTEAIGKVESAHTKQIDNLADTFREEQRESRAAARERQESNERWQKSLSDDLRSLRGALDKDEGTRTASPNKPGSPEGS